MTRKRARSVWTPDRDQALARAWARGAAEEAARATGRTASACARRARELGLADPSAGCVTPAALARALGYSVGKVINAARALGLALAAWPTVSYVRAPAGRRRRMAITPEQQRSIAGFLAKRTRIFGPGSRHGAEGAWGDGRKPPACLGHGGTDRPHAAGGYCKGCYNRLARAGRPPAPLPPVPSPRALRRLDAPLSRGRFDGDAIGEDVPPPEVVARLAREHVRHAAVADVFAGARGAGQEFFARDAYRVQRRGSAA